MAVHFLSGALTKPSENPDTAEYLVVCLSCLLVQELQTIELYQL